MSNKKELIMVSLDILVDQNHIYRKFIEIFNFSIVSEALKDLKKEYSCNGYGIERLFKCLLLQFMEDLSDRELERFLKDSNAAKWFCEFSLDEKTPHYTLFTKVRTRVGTKTLSEIFRELRIQLKKSGYMNETFTFIDASHLIAKANLWKERDKAIKEKYEKLNNESLPKIAKDKDARIGCKGKDKFWYGYKKHVSVDIQSGMINKIAITKANITDSNGFKNVIPSQGAVYTDKGYCVGEAPKIAQKRGLHLAAIKKNNMKGKNKDLDKYYSKIRSPFESVFSKQRRRVRFRGISRNQFAEFFYAICFNLRRMLVLIRQA